jgi:signal transduction histidine kinase/ligand-binding sensor domain-containing protein
MLVRTWDAEDGMPQSTGRCIAQTPDGFIWAGTFNGLVRFDGVSFEVFNVANTPALPENDIYNLFVDSAGRLWIQTNTKGLVVYDDGDFTYPEQPFGMLGSVNIAEIPDGRIYIASLEGVFIYQGKGQEFKKILSTVQLQDDIEGIFPDDRGGLFIALGSNLVRLKPDGQLESLGFEGKQVNFVKRDISGSYWIHCEVLGELNEGIDEDEDHLLLWDDVSGAALVDFRGEFSSSLIADPSGGVWVGNDRSGISHFTAEGMTDVQWNMPLPEYEVGALFADRQGRLWIGSDGGGISVATSRKFDAYTVNHGLTSNNVITVASAPDGRMMVGTYYNGISIQRTETPERWEALGGVWGDNSVLSMVTRADGTLLMAGGKGTALFDGDTIHYAKLIGQEADMRENRRIRARLSRSGPELELPGHRYRALMESKDGALWIGSRFFGAFRVLADTLEVFDHDDLPHLGKGRINCFLDDQEGCVWIGTSAGLNRWMPGGKIEGFEVRDGLPAGEIHSLGMDSTGRVLVGTAGSGLGIFDPDGKRFKMLNAGNGLPNEVVAQIIEDDFGYLWLGTNAGICRFSLADLTQFVEGNTDWVTISRFGRQAGMVHPECTGGFHPSCFKDSSGRLWFATVGGVVSMDPNTFEDSQEKPTAHIRTVRIGKRNFQPLETSINDPLPRYQIHPNPSILEISYTGLSYDDPLSLRFQYRLFGYDADWLDVRNERIARYPNLPPGQFQFEVRVRNHLGQWNTQPEMIAITILPAWWETRLFQVGAIGLALLLGFGLHRYRIHLLEKAHILEETFTRRSAQFQEQDRKQIASDLHDTVAQELLLVRRQTQRLLKDPELGASHRTRIEGMDDTTRSALEDLRNSIYMLWPRELENATPSEALASLLDRISKETGLIVKSDIKALSLSLPVGTKIHLYRILQEALQNVVRHAHANQVEVRAEVKDRQCLITIQDNGVGMEMEEAKLESYGLATMTHRANWINGVLTLSSSLGQGVRVLLKFPLP